jgi:hydroxylaminobenzene mutase
MSDFESRPIAIRRGRQGRRCGTLYEHIGPIDASGTPSAADRRGPVPVYIVRGIAIPYFAAPLLARSAHSLAALLGVILIALGLLWPRLNLAKAASRIAFWFLVYSGLAITAAFLIAGIWGAGKSTMPLAGAPMGTPFQEAVIAAVAYSSAPTGIIAFALILWGLRLGTR